MTTALRSAGVIPTTMVDELDGQHRASRSAPLGAEGRHICLRQLRDALMPDVNGDAAQALFDDAKTRQSVLSKYATPAAVLVALSDLSGAPWAEREALTRALLAEEQARPHPFWAALLLSVFYPMLLRLRGRIRGRVFDSADVDQLVVATFLEVALAFPLDQRRHRTCMYLKQMTERQVFQAARRESDIQALTSLQSVENVDPTRLLPWPSPRFRCRTKTEPAIVDASAAVALLASRASFVAKDQIDLLVATVVRDEPLRLYVDRVFAEHDEVDRDRAYQRLKRRRSRTLIRLRPLFADLHSGDLGEPEIFLTGGQP